MPRAGGGTTVPPLPTSSFEKFVEAVAKLAQTPNLGTPYAYPEIPNVRRLLMRRTKYHVYYVYRPNDDEVWVLSVWRAMRGRGPELNAP